MHRQDRLIARSRKKTGKLHHEQRLLATIPGAVLLPLGLLIYGFCIQYNEAKDSYVGACVAMAVSVASLPGVAKGTLLIDYLPSAYLLLRSSYYLAMPVLCCRLLQATGASGRQVPVRCD